MTRAMHIRMARNIANSLPRGKYYWACGSEIAAASNTLPQKEISTYFSNVYQIYQKKDVIACDIRGNKMSQF